MSRVVEDVRTSPGVPRTALVLGGLTAFGPLSIDMYLPALPRIADDLHAADATVQLTLTSFIVGLAIGQLVLGPLSDSLGRRRPLLAGLALYVVGSLLCAISPTSGVLIAARALQALGAAAGMVIARATVRDLFSGIAMTRFFSTLTLVIGLAPILAPVIGSQLLAWTSWRGVFYALAGFGALLLTVVTLLLPESLPPALRSPTRVGSALRAYARLLGERSFVGYALASGLMFAALFAYVSGSSFALQGVYGLSPQAYSLVFGLNGVGIMISGVVNRRLVGRFSGHTMLLSGLVLAAVGGTGVLAAVLLDLGLVGLLVPLFLLVSAFGIVLPNATSLALAEHAKSAGAASALLGVLQFVIGGGVATPLVGLGGPGTALPMALVIAGFAVLALVVSLVLNRPAAGRTV
ncbi:multidrug effflux MFS transporter [Umezawaea tangerina]|uniref:DHA1 family bicyclomycin/chloramphenicol resistance-like MFS transporter n=1 Tax=Umezawaea tangerina TaxID=84725 RepID=A0A2T0T441_9PSEU|nr:multidrug effflux MFS transporter [Umezawaea tangerina]PRY40401.1 DHA1 family bicyclomycin/chloramphenicol resistance-like MFS transporter [Umezawaea tangerina]